MIETKDTRQVAVKRTLAIIATGNKMKLLFLILLLFTLFFIHFSPFYYILSQFQLTVFFIYHFIFVYIPPGFCLSNEKAQIISGRGPKCVCVWKSNVVGLSIFLKNDSGILRASVNFFQVK